MPSTTKSAGKKPAGKLKVSVRRPRRRLVLTCIWLIVFACLFALFYVSYSAAFSGRIYPQVSVGGVKVGGLKSAVAQEKLSQAASKVTEVKLVVEEKALPTLTLADLGLNYDPKLTAEKAFAYGRTGDWWTRLGARLKTLFVAQRLDPVLQINDDQFQKTLDERLYQPQETDAKEATLAVKDGVVTAVAGEAGLVLDHQLVESQIKNRLNSFSGAPISLVRQSFSPKFTVADLAVAKQQAERMLTGPLTISYKDTSFAVTVDQIGAWIITTQATSNNGITKTNFLVADVDLAKITTYVKSLAFDQINRDPQDARVRFNNGRVEVFQPSQTGVAVKEKETAAAIKDALDNRAFGKTVDQIGLVVEEKTPTVTENSLSNLGINELIGRAATDYGTSPANRKHNIAIGATKVNGTVLQNGEEFSLVKTLGVIDASTGYLPELVITKNHLEKQFGGGLCQPTTTLFRAVLDAGLPVTDRTNHSRRVSYYEQPSNVAGVRINWDKQYANLGNSLVGYDATVFDPAPDLKFVNDTGHAVLVQAYVTNDKQVTFELYGTNDGRKVQVSKAEVLYTKPIPDPQFSPDPTKPSNTMEKVEKGVPGAKTRFSYTITYADGHTATKAFESFYAAIPDQFLVGTAEPAPLPDAVPAPAQ